MGLSGENVCAHGASMESEPPRPELDYSAWDAPGAYDPRPDLLAEERRLARRHEVVMGWLDLAKDFGAGCLLGFLAVLASFVGALALMAGA